MDVVFWKKNLEKYLRMPKIVKKNSIKKTGTPPKFNIAPEQWWLEGYFPFG